MRVSTRLARPEHGCILIMMAALGLATAGCATTGGVPKPFPGAPSAAGATGSTGETGATGAMGLPTEAQSAKLGSFRFDGSAIAQFALGFRGVPYRLGGADPAGFDCSGLVQYVFAQYGISVPRIVEQQYEVGRKVKPSELRPGDLVFFNTEKRGRGASHVAIAIGGNNFVHAPNSAGVVRVEPLSSSYWSSRYLGARRINY